MNPAFHTADFDALNSGVREGYAPVTGLSKRV
jgi:hypothetical protein